MSDGMYEALTGRGKSAKVREVAINKYVDVLVYKDRVLISNKKEQTTIALKKKTLAKIVKEMVK
jgi:hypothetical protein